MPFIKMPDGQGNVFWLNTAEISIVAFNPDISKYPAGEVKMVNGEKLLMHPAGAAAVLAALDKISPQLVNEMP